MKQRSNEIKQIDNKEIIKIKLNKFKFKNHQNGVNSLFSFLPIYCFSAVHFAILLKDTSKFLELEIIFVKISTDCFVGVIQIDSREKLDIGKF
jgi:hypothetical protein